ncbi:MAG TPA: hypothetical protein VIL12_03735, partial [Acidimicrobiia bacterium]
MRRRLALAISVVAGAMAGALLMLGSQGVWPVDQPTAATRGPTLVTIPAPTTSGNVEVRPAPPSDQVMLAWTPGGLPEGLAAQVGRLPGVEAVTSVRSDLVHLIESRDAEGDLVALPPDAGFAIPIEVMAFDPITYRAFVPKQ